MNIEESVLVALCIVLAAVGIATRNWSRRRVAALRRQHLEQQCRELDGHSILAEIRAQGTAIQVLAGALDRLQQQLQLDARHVARPVRGGRAGYELAIRLAQGGASIEEICASCGMSRAEADLVLRLHRDGNSPAASRQLAMAG